MNPVVQSLFHELADLPPSEREKFFAAHQIAGQLRAEIEALLSFDSTSEHGVSERVVNAAKEVLESYNKAVPLQWGPYRRIRVLGAGGMGTVYLAERIDGEIQTKVAVKLLRADSEKPGWRERFLRERQLLACLNHSAIARLIDAGHTDDGRPYLVMEYVDGVPIDVCAVKIDLREQLMLFLRACEGVSHAHSHLIIHRDLKPSNILVDASGQPKLLDFGIAKLLDETEDPTRTIDRLLTPNYASPEQLHGNAGTTATDVYSLGAVLHKILTGRSPNEPGASYRNLPSDLEYVLRKALRIEPDERYVSVEAFANDIQAFLDWRPVQARAGDRWYRTRRFLRRYWIPVCATALVVAGLSAGLYVVNRERNIAQHRFEQLRQLSNKVLQLDTLLRLSPGSTQARDEIVAMSKDYLEGLLAEGRPTNDLGIELAGAFVSLAEAQGVPIVNNLGHYTQADESLIKADTLAEGVLASSPHDRKALFMSAKINHDRMILADTDSRRDAAIIFAKKSADRLETYLAAGIPSESERRNAYSIFSNLALVHKNLRLYTEAVRYGRRAVEVGSPIPNGRLHVAGAVSIVADALRLSGDLEAALSTIEEARSSLETYNTPDEAQRVVLLSAVLWRQGLILGGDGQVSLMRSDEAMTTLRQSFDMIEEAAAKDPNDARSRILFVQHGRELGNLLSRHDPTRALAVFDHAIQRVREVKENAKARRGEAQLLAASSYPLRQLNRIGESRQRIDRAFELLKEAKSYPANTIHTDDEAETLVQALGDHFADTGDLQRAIETYRELLNKLLASHPEPDKDLSDATVLSHLYEALIRFYRSSGDSEKAETVSATRLKIWQSWNRKLPSSVFIQRELASASAS